MSELRICTIIRKIFTHFEFNKSSTKKLAWGKQKTGKVSCPKKKDGKTFATN